MPRGIRLILTLAVAGLATAGGGAERLFSPARDGGAQRPSAMPAEKVAGGFVLERDQDVAKEEPGTHKAAERRLATRFSRTPPDSPWSSGSARSSRARRSATTSRRRTRSTTSSAAAA